MVILSRVSATSGDACAVYCHPPTRTRACICPSLLELPVAIRHNPAGSGSAGTLAIVPFECYLLMSVLFPTLSTAEVRIVGVSGFGVYLGLLFGFCQRCMHIAVVIVPSSYPFPPSPRLLEVQRFPYSPLLSFLGRSRSLPWCLSFSLFSLYCVARISYPT